MHRTLRRMAVVGLALSALSACSWQFGSWGPAADTPPSIQATLAGKHRSPEFRARDDDRHPAEVLAFFGLQPQQTVVEVWPGGGYWTEILAPYLKAEGRYIAAHFAASDPATPDWRRQAVERFRDKLSGDPGRYDQVVLSEIGAPRHWTPAAPGSADLVLTFRNVHNWMKGEYASGMFASFYDSLKPGGILGVVEHRAKPGTPWETMIRSGYVTEAQVIELAEGAGFRLLARSELNANPLDDRDHPAGVWTLPPSLRLGEQDRPRYLTIGESDRMTLKFVKPILVAPAG